MTLNDPTQATIIRTHDRMLFKKCRVLWNYQSPNRHNYTTVRPPIALAFGTAMHSGLEQWYRPELSADPIALRKAEAVVLFADTLKSLLTDHYPDEQITELMDLGRAMLIHYIEHYANEHMEWLTEKTEISFSVPIPLERIGAKAYDNVTYIMQDDKPYLAELVTIPGFGTVPQLVKYEGQLDLISRLLKTGGLWIWDHKTIERLDIDGLLWLDQDDQVNAYYWIAYIVLGLQVDGILFNYLKKKHPPLPPKLLSNGKKLSVDKSQSTTIALYMKEIERYGFNPADYQEFLAAYESPVYFHREPVNKRAADLEQIEKDIVLQSREMISAGDNIYPNPNMLNCRNCPFQLPCKMRQRGEDDIQWISTSGIYKQNTDYGAPVDVQDLSA